MNHIPPQEETTEPLFDFQIDDAPLTVWGSSPRKFRGFHFTEWLPALFERTLGFTELSQSDEDELSWIFTGERAGFTVSIKEGRLCACQYFYDSYGLFFDESSDEPAGKTMGRFPRRVFGEKQIPLPDLPIKNLTVRVDRRLMVSVNLNGRELFSQRCVFDVSQHQLQLTGNCTARGTLFGPASISAQVTIETKKRRQKIIGFGGTTSIPCYHMLSEDGKSEWWKLLKEYNFLVQREYPPGLSLKHDLSNWDDLKDARPHYYGDNFPNSEIVDFEYNKRLFSMGGTTWFEFWFLPGWVKAEKLQHETNAVLENPGLDVAEYCRTVVDYCEKSKAHCGTGPSIVGIQNERCQPLETLKQLVPALRTALDRAGFSEVRIHMSNAGTVEEAEIYRERFQDPDVWQHIDFATTNIYDMQKHLHADMDAFGDQLATLAQRFGERDKLNVETAIQWGRFQIDSYRLALRIGELNHYLLTRFDARSLCYCWLLLHTPQPSFSATRSLWKIDMSQGGIPVASSNLLRTFGAFSRHLPPGSERIDCSSTAQDLLVSAYLHPEKAGRQGWTVILLNRGISPIKVAFNVPIASSGRISAESCSPYGANRLLPGIVHPVEGEIQVRVESGEIITLFTSVIQG